LASFKVDQAEGLRRLLDKPKSRVLTMFSVLPEQDRNMMLVNFGAALAATGSKVLVVDASATSNALARHVGAASMPTLCDVLTQDRNMHEAVRIVPSLMLLKRRFLQLRNMQKHINCPSYLTLWQNKLR
jgi:flagellar biosynthesis protein FlhG